jgi:hypothetical protein
MLSVELHEEVVGVGGFVFDFHSLLLSNGVHYIRHQKMVKPFRFCGKIECLGDEY